MLCNTADDLYILTIPRKSNASAHQIGFYKQVKVEYGDLSIAELHLNIDREENMLY